MLHVEIQSNPRPACANLTARSCAQLCLWEALYMISCTLVIVGVIREGRKDALVSS